MPQAKPKNYLKMRIGSRNEIEKNKQNQIEISNINNISIEDLNLPSTLKRARGTI